MLSFVLHCVPRISTMDGDSPVAVKREVDSPVPGSAGKAATVADKVAPAAKGESGGQPRGPPAVAEGQQCFAMDCFDARLRNQKWCAKHKRAYAAMYMSAKKQDTLVHFNQLMANETQAKLAMRDWCHQNPPDGKWSRKRLLDFTQYTEAQGRLAYEGDADGDEPKTEAEFLRWAVDVKCLTTAGAERWWQDLQTAASRRDFKGRHADGTVGALRLWVPSVELSERKRGRYEDSKVTSGSKQIKKMAEADVDELRDLALSRPVDDAFLRGEKRARDPDLGSEGVVGGDARSFAGSAASDDAAPTPSPVKQVDLALVKPKTITKHKNEFRALQSSLIETAKKGLEQWVLVNKAGEGEAGDSDSALKALAVHLQFRLNCIAAFNSYSSAVAFLEGQDIFADKVLFGDLLTNNQDKLPVPEEMLPNLNMTANELDVSFEDIKSVTSVAELEDKKDTWAKQKTALKALEKGVATATKDVKAHKSQKEKENIRKMKADQKKKEKDELEAHKESSDLRAKALLEEKQQGTAKPAYKACQFMLQKMIAGDLPEGFKVLDFEYVSATNLGSREKPWFLNDKDVYEKWALDSNIRKTSQSFALKYKTFGDYHSKGRVSAAMEPKHGGDTTAEFFRQFVSKPLDVSSLDQCQNFQNTAWLSGFSPTMRFVGLQANGCVTLKGCLLGEVLHASISCAELLKGLESIGKIQKDSKFASMDAFCHTLEDLDMDAFVKMQQAGVNIYVHKMIPGEVLNVPLAWFTFEQAVEGAVVVSARCGYFAGSPSASETENYAAMRKLLELCGKNTERYDQIIELMTKSVGPSS